MIAYRVSLCERPQQDRVVQSSGCGARHPGWNSSSAISCLSALGQVTHPLCLSFPICKKEVIALLLKVTGRIKGSISDLCASLQ